VTTKSKRKGNGFESELVKLFRSKGWYAERAWGSNGVSLGEAPDVDVVASWPEQNQKWLIQAKRRAKLPEYLIPSDTVDAVIAREDRGEPIVVLRFADFMKLVGGPVYELVTVEIHWFALNLSDEDKRASFEVVLKDRVLDEELFNELAKSTKGYGTVFLGKPLKLNDWRKPADDNFCFAEAFFTDVGLDQLAGRVRLKAGGNSA
jgi:Holliday junction resolvase